jgi:hypothetical protein
VSDLGSRVRRAPNSLSAAAAATTITVTGARFTAGSVVEIDQVAQATTFVSGTSLTISYDPATAGAHEVTVRNPSGQESNSVALAVTALQEDEPTPEPDPEPGPAPADPYGTKGW